MHPGLFGLLVMGEPSQAGQRLCLVGCKIVFAPGCGYLGAKTGEITSNELVFSKGEHYDHLFQINTAT